MELSEFTLAEVLLQTILRPGGSGLSSIYNNLCRVFLYMLIQYFMLHIEFLYIFFCTIEVL